MRAEIRLAERLGISPRRLWGEEPATRLTPDGEGGFVVEREPEFTAHDIELFEAARIVDESLSPRGIPFAAEMDKASRFKVGAQRNFAVAAQERKEREYKATEGTNMDGMIFPVELVE